MRISVMGTGYVGLVVAACLAESGHRIVGMDIDYEKIEQLRRGECPIYEPGLAELVQRGLSDGRLAFTVSEADAVRHGEVIIIAVDTPTGEDGDVNLSHVFNVGESIARHIDSYKIIVTKSTVPVGTTEKIRKCIASRTDVPFDVASSPEFLKEGDAIRDFMKPDRVVIGVDKPGVGALLRQLYAPFVRTEKPILVMDIRSAEMAKYASNAMLATKISVMNEIANLCDKVGADVEQVRKAVGADSRIGYAFIFAGLGWGGSCLPKDLKALIQLGRKYGYSLRIADAVDIVNQDQPQLFFQKVYAHFQGKLQGRKIAVWGLSFKPKTDDLRDAPSLITIEALLAQNAVVSAYDPQANGKAELHFCGRIELTESAYQCLEGAEALLLVTEWDEFRNPDFELVKSKMNNPVIFDGRNLFDPAKLRALGFTYHGLGRP